MLETILLLVLVGPVESLCRRGSPPTCSRGLLRVVTHSHCARLQNARTKKKNYNINTHQHHERKSRAGKVNFLAAFPAVFSTLPPAACQPSALSLSVTSAARSATEPGTSAPEADPMTSPRSPGSLRRWIQSSVLIITIVF